MINTPVKIIQENRGRLQLITKVQGETYPILCQMPGYKKWFGRKLTFEPTEANIAHIVRHFENIEWQDGTHKLFEEFVARQMAMEDVKQMKRNIDPFDDPSGYVYKTEPMKHQREAFIISRDEYKFGLFMEPGTGKTKVVIDTAAYLFEQGEIDSLIVIAPNGVHVNWARIELERHCPIDYRVYSYRACKRLKRQKKDLDDVHERSYKGLRIFCFNVETFSTETSRAKDIIADCMSWYNPMVVVDESTRIKSPKAKRTKYLLKAFEGARYKRIMTGTPITNGIENLYTQLKFLGNEICGFSSFYTFRNEYCVVGGFKNKQIVGYRNQEKLVSRLEGVTYRVLKEDCMDLPTKVYQRWYFNMTSMQQAIYNNMKNHAIMVLDQDNVSIADNPLTQLLRLQQITCNWRPDEKNPGQVKPVDVSKNPRFAALEEILEDLGPDKKSIIWAKYKNDIELISEKLGRRCVTYYGETSADERTAAIDEFQNGDAQYFVGTPSAAGIGLTLTAADTVIYYSNDYDLEKRLQSEDRAHRIDNERMAGRDSILYIDICCDGTVDEKIIKALQAKKKISDEILKDPKGYFLEL